MSDEKKQVTVELTAGEVEGIDQKASEQGVSTPDFLAYCVRAISFGISYAVSMLPKQGQSGTSEG
ncbi:hypothetical protein [Paraburkholderia sp. BL9I2N2]|uniref:hypothetical protein n=1 Tax=Paraburkholderia sp. BL9I2N2 TaxID=1938809 RepID=UPI00105345D1|nr:hypothetical protein [Paraburkholderia sp. BL9I2N2]TCK87334.1 hypothetical protein B0G74_7873 [Paraburkholderia sp. BL9I2N2]